jgi:murein DD-endopeptidase MepM/ murein hydrolase activator NlpD
MRARTGTLAVLASTAVALGTLGAGTPAVADDDQRRKRALDVSIERTRDDLHETSKEFSTAAVQLRRVQSSLAAAQAAVAQARARLAEAKAREARLAAQLQVALREEARAQAEVDAMVARMEETRQLIAGIARTTYQQGPMADLAVYLDADSPEDFVARLAYTHSAVRSEQALLERLAADKAVLDAKKAALEAKRAQIAELRAEAAANVTRMAGMERAAVAAQQRVARLVAQAKTVQARIARERAKEQRRLARMESEAQALQRRLAERARKARAAAAARARRGSGRDRDNGWSGGGGIFAVPVYARISSPFGMRVHPVTGVYKLHDGTDFAASCGTPIRAAADGVVIESGYSGAWGNRLVVEHGMVRGRYIATAYNHMTSYAVRSGAVSRGQVIGYIGSTGYSTGCHLHFNLYVNGTPVNPMAWL